MDDSTRQRIIKDPQVILEDQDVMQALIKANDAARGTNIVDLRGIAMARLEGRLDRLEETHRDVIAAAYDNVAGTSQIHRAILRLLEPDEFESFLAALNEDIAAILRVDKVRLVLETAFDPDDKVVKRVGDPISVVPEGFIKSYLSGGGRKSALRQITLHQLEQGNADIYGGLGSGIKSEACLLLDMKDGQLPGMLVLGTKDPEYFAPQQGTDLLSFFCGVFERTLHNWLG